MSRCKLCGKIHDLIIDCKVKRETKYGLFKQMKLTDNVVTKSVLRGILIRRFENNE